MKNLLLIFFVFGAEISFAQREFDYKIDTNVTITISENYEVHDTLGQQVIVTQFKSNQMLISKLPLTGDNELNIKDAQDLKLSYKGMIDGALEQSSGKLLQKEVVEKSNLLLNTCVYQAVVNGKTYNLEFLGFHLDKYVYMIQIYKPATEVNSSNEILGIVKFSKNLSISNQINDMGKTDNYQLGYRLGYNVFGPLVLILGIVLLIRWISKRK